MSSQISWSLVKNLPHWCHIKVVNSIAARPKATTQKRIFNFWNEKIYQTTNALEYQDSGNNSRSSGNAKYLSQPTLRWGCEKASRMDQGCVFQWRKTCEVATNVYLKKTLEKPKKDDGLHSLKMRVRELFVHGKGISTSRACHKGRQPLIECARHDFKIMYFSFLCFLCISSFYIFFIFLGSTRILGCDEEIRYM